MTPRASFGDSPMSTRSFGKMARLAIRRRHLLTTRVRFMAVDASTVTGRRILVLFGMAVLTRDRRFFRMMSGLQMTFFASHMAFDRLREVHRVFVASPANPTRIGFEHEPMGTMAVGALQTLIMKDRLTRLVTRSARLGDR